MDVAVAHRIKSIIRAKGMVQKAVAERAGFQPHTFSNMLTGKKLILADYIPSIANALGITPNELFDTGNFCPSHGSPTQ